MNTMKLIKAPYFIDYINSMVIDGCVESSLWDFQEALNLSDDEIESQNENINLTNYECFNNRGQKITFTISDNAEIEYKENLGFSVHDIFGVLITLSIVHYCNAVTTMDALLQNSMIDPSQNYSDIPVLDWLKKYQGKINYLVDVSFLITDELTPEHEDNSLKFLGDLQVGFRINGQEFNISVPSLLTFKNIQGEIVLDYSALDIDVSESYEDFLRGKDHIPEAEIDVLIKTIRDQFYRYFNLEKVPMWQDRLLNSFKHDDLLN